MTIAGTGRSHPPSRRPGRSGFSLVELLVVLAIFGLLAGLTAAGVQKVRVAADRTSCQNKLRQIGLAAANYHAALGGLPPGMSDKDFRPTPAYEHMSWLTRLLPYIEQNALWAQAVEGYRQYPTDFTKSPPHPFGQVVKSYTCPSDYRVALPQLTRGRYMVGLTSYLGVSGTLTVKADGVLFRNSSVRFTDVTDGTSQTVLAGERPPSPDFWFGWWYAGFGSNGTGSGDMILGVRDGSPQPGANIPDCGKLPTIGPGAVDSMCDTFHYWSPHPGGVHFLFADGSVRFLAYTAGSVLPALATRAGGETVDVP